MHTGERRSLRRASTAEKASVPHTDLSPPSVRKRASDQLPENAPIAKKRKTGKKSTMSSKKVNTSNALENQSVEPHMDSDDAKPQQSSASIPIAGKKTELPVTPHVDPDTPEEDEKKVMESYGDGDSEGNEEEEAQGGLFGDVDASQGQGASGTPLHNLMEHLMNAHVSRGFNPTANAGGRWKEYVVGLQSGDEMIQLDTLINLADELCVMTEETTHGFKLDHFIPPLVTILNTSDNPNTVLLACRCMSHILEALPGSETSFVRHDAVPGLVEKLLNIEYDDLRDQAMNVLSRLCAVPASASAVLKNGGLVAILANLDFSAIATQVTAVTCAANMLRHIPSDAWPHIRDALPTLAMLLQYEDLRLVEKSTTSLASICTHYIADKEKLEEVVSCGALLNLVRLVTERMESKSTEISNLTWLVIRCLATLCKGLPGTAETLVSAGIPGILKTMLLMERENATKGLRQSAKTNTQAVYDMVALVDQLLPPMPPHVAEYLKHATPTPQALFAGRMRGLFGLLTSSQQQEVDLMSSGSIPPPSDPSQPDARTVFYQQNPTILLQVSESLLKTLTLVFGSRVNPQLRIKCLSGVAKIIFACTSEMLASLLKDLTFSSFLAGLLGSKDLKFIAVSLAIAENLMVKLPDIFAGYFMREGVVHEVEQLISCGAQFKPVSATVSTPTRSPAPSTPLSTSVPSTPNENSYLVPITPTAPSFMWEALASPPNPSMMKARFGTKEAHTSSSSPSASAVASASISFGNEPPKSPLASTAISFGSGPSTPAQDHGHPSSIVDMAESPVAQIGTPTATAAATPDANEALRLEIVEMCVQFKKRWFESDNIASSEGLEQLTVLTETLTNSLWQEKDMDKLKATLSDVADIFLSGVSTHEFVHSTLPTALFQFLTLSGTEVPTSRSERILAFVYIFGKRARYSPSDDAMMLSSSTGSQAKTVTSPWLQLVKELQNAIEKNENFQVKLNASMLGGGVRANAIVEFLTKAFLVKLVKDPAEKTLPTILEGPVSVEPLATGQSVKGFILNKVKQALAQEARRKAETEKKNNEEKAPRTPIASRTRSKADPQSMDTDESHPSPKSSTKSDAKSTSSPGEKKATPVLSTSEMQQTLASSTSSASSSSQSQSGPGATEEQMPLYGDIGDGDEDLDAIDEDSIDHGDDGVHVQEVSPNSRPESPVVSPRAPTSAPAAETSSSTYNLQNLVITLNGMPMSDTVSFFKLLKEKANADLPPSSSEIAAPLAPLWAQTHTIQYRLVDPTTQPEDAPLAQAGDDEEKRTSAPYVNLPGDVMRYDVAGASLERVLEKLMRGEVGAACSFDKTLVQLLSLLKVLETLNLELPRIVPLASAEDIIPVPTSDFINPKLSAKLARQLQDPLALCTNTLPSWCASLCIELPFLFPMDLRQLYFRGSSLGVPRALLALKDRVEGVLHGNFGRIAPHKVRVQRDSIKNMNSAFVVLQRVSADPRSMLEVEYANEVATGSGPTLEFYTLVSHAFQQTRLNMWVSGGDAKTIRHGAAPTSASDSSTPSSTSVSAATPSSASEGSKSGGNTGATTASEMVVVSNDGGLFPLPILASTDPEQAKEVVKYFSFLGTFIAKAIMDDRMIDMPFSVAFFKGLLGAPLLLHDLQPIYPQLVQTIRDFQGVLAQKKEIEEDATLSVEEKAKKVEAIKYKGGSIESMWLTFDLPGVNLELVPGGSDKALTIHNLEEWVTHVVDAISGAGVAAQFDALKTGFAQIFDVSRLVVFEPQELETLICGTLDQDWSKEAILDAAAYSQGYTVNSKVSQWFAAMLSEFTELERRKFLRFVTGSPRLPPRGFKGFHHRLTLSRKDPEKNRKPDDYFPSVSTCFLFVKIPDYSSFEVFKDRFFTAIENGQQGFGLS